MTLENEFLTHDDKPYAENFNSSKLVSNIFDLTIPVIYPDNCKTDSWGQVGSVKKCDVGIVEIVEKSSGVSINRGDVSGTGTVKVKFYPNFDTFDKITSIEWIYELGTVTCDLYTQTGQLIQSDIPNGAQTSASAELKKLQNFELRFNLTDADLESFMVVMKNTKTSPTNGKIGISDVNNLQFSLDSKVNVSDIKDNLNSADTDKPLSANQGKILKTAVDGKASTSHTHSISNITSLQSSLDGKAPTAHTHTKSQITDFSHTHDDRYYTESEMNTKLNGKANSSHTHAAGDLPTASTSAKGVIQIGTGATNAAAGNHTHDDRYYTESEMNTKLNGKANSSHTHNISDVTSLQNSLDGKASSSHSHGRTYIDITSSSSNPRVYLVANTDVGGFSYQFHVNNVTLGVNSTTLLSAPSGISDSYKPLNQIIQPLWAKDCFIQLNTDLSVVAVNFSGSSVTISAISNTFTYFR